MAVIKVGSEWTAGADRLAHSALSEVHMVKVWVLQIQRSFVAGWFVHKRLSIALTLQGYDRQFNA
jgi:hypothetical protein